MLHWNILFVFVIVTITLQVSGLPESSVYGRRYRRADTGDDADSSPKAQGDEPHDKTESEKTDTAPESRTSDGDPGPSDGHPVSSDENGEPSESHSDPSSDQSEPVAGHQDEQPQSSDEHPKLSDGDADSSEDHPAPSNDHPAPSDGDAEKSDDHPASSDSDTEQSIDHPAPSDGDAEQPDHPAPSDDHSEPSDDHPAPSDDNPAPSDSNKEQSDDHPAPSDGDAEQPDQPPPSDDHSAPSDDDAEQSDDHPAPLHGDAKSSDDHPVPSSEHLEPSNPEPSDHQPEPEHTHPATSDDHPVPSDDGSKSSSDPLEASEDAPKPSDTGSSDQHPVSSDNHPEPLESHPKSSEENSYSSESSGEVATESDKHPDELLTVIEDALKTSHADTPKEEAGDQGSPPATAAPDSEASKDDSADEDKEETAENVVDHLLTEDKEEKDKTHVSPGEEDTPAKESTETSDDTDDASQDEEENADDETPASSPASTPPPSSSDREAESEADEGEKKDSEVVPLPSHVEDDAADREEHSTPLLEASSAPKSEEDEEKSVLVPEGETGEKSSDDAAEAPVTEPPVGSEKEEETLTASPEVPEDEAATEEVIDPDVADMLNTGSSKLSDDSDTEDLPTGSEGLVLGSVTEETEDVVVTSPAPASGEADKDGNTGLVVDADDDDEGENGKPKPEDGDVVTTPLTPSSDDDSKGDLLVLSADKSQEESEDEKLTAEGETTTETPQDGNGPPGEESDDSLVSPVVAGSGAGNEIAEESTPIAQSSTLAPEEEDPVAEGEGHDAPQDAAETAPPQGGNNDTETGVVAPVVSEPGVDESGEEKSTTDDPATTGLEDEASSLDGSGDEESMKEADDVGNNTHAGADTEVVDVNVDHLSGDRTSTAATLADTTLAILTGEERKNETDSGPIIDVGASVDESSGTALSPPESTSALPADDGKNETAVGEVGPSSSSEDDDGSGDVTDDKSDGVAVVDTTTTASEVEKNETDAEAGVVVGVDDALSEESTPAAASPSTTPPETTSTAEAEEPDGVDVVIPHDGDEQEETGEKTETETTQRIPPLEELESSTPYDSEVIDLEPANTSGIVVDDGKETGDNGTSGEKDGDKMEDVDVSVNEEAENTTRSRPGLRRGPGVPISVEGSEDNQSGTKVQSAQQKESEDDSADKQRTAIIVGVTIGGIALFAIGFLASRYCKKRGGFKIMKKVPQDVGNGNSDAIEFRPVHTGVGNYDEVDEVNRASNKPIYRRPPPKATYTPLKATYTPLTTSAAPNDDVYTVPDKKKPAHGEEPQDSYINGIDKIRFMDETTDDEADATPKDRLLQPRPREEDVQEEEEEFFSTPEAEVDAEEDVKQSPESTASGDSPTSFTTAVMMNLDKRGTSEDGSEAQGPSYNQS